MAVVLEAVEADQAESFRDFCASRCGAHFDLSGWPGEGQITVETVAGHRLEMAYEGPHSIDGEHIDYNAYPLFDGPGLDAPTDTGMITFRHDGDELTLDFDIDQGAAVLPIRAIG
jgi:endogenous inhibitor of DNA gyrase (YacG/DUF329 family)